MPACRAPTSSDETTAAKRSAIPAASSTASISGRFEDDATASGNSAASRRTASTAPSISGSVVAVALEHPADDLVVDLLRRLGEPQLVVHVPRPLGRAHPHHRGLRAVVPATAALAHQLLAHVVPHLLAVDDHTVEVEDDRLDHAAL